ncbi:hypothetical protein BBJ28_00024723 [Nothophytophthora sp. Chile5]|nr:hypothetical protein BBJ28_00024723 [Nothophytophthora sp. Chile5]
MSEYSAKKEGTKRRKVMNTEVFETPDPEEGFQAYAPANASARQVRGGLGSGPEAEGHFHDKNSMELDEQELPANQAFEVFMGKVYIAVGAVHAAVAGAEGAGGGPNAAGGGRQ